MSNLCRAKNPSTCRIHGTGGEYARLQEEADRAAVSGNVSSYIAIRQKMDKLEDSPETTGDPSFVAPDTADKRMEPWLTGDKFSSHTPHNILLTAAYESEGNPYVSLAARDLLQQRGYEHSDLVMERFFGFKKEDSDDADRTIQRRDAFGAMIDIEVEEMVFFDDMERDALVDKHFPSQAEDNEIPVLKEHCKGFMKDIKNELDKKVENFL